MACMTSNIEAEASRSLVGDEKCSDHERTAWSRSSSAVLLQLLGPSRGRVARPPETIANGDVVPRTVGVNERTGLHTEGRDYWIGDGGDHDA